MAALWSSARAVAASLAAFALAEVSGCGTDAVGVERCRTIELARCDAAKACGTIDDVEACRRFYHDQCLHGLPGADPGVNAAKACGAMLERATACANEGGPEVALADCADPVTSEPSVAAGVCELVASPELAGECRFLDPDAPIPGEPGSGGAGGATSEGTAGAAPEGGNGGEPAASAGSGGAAPDEPAAGAAGVPVEE
jgi:hypothetical protein